MTSRRWWIWFATWMLPAIWLELGRGPALVAVALTIAISVRPRRSLRRTRHRVLAPPVLLRSTSFAVKAQRRAGELHSRAKPPRRRERVNAGAPRPASSGTTPHNTPPKSPMNTVALTCPACAKRIKIVIEHAVLRVDVEPTPEAELLFCCPACEAPGVKTVLGDLLTQLLLVGARPVALAEPTLDPSDLAPDRPPFTREDLLEWHEQLADVDCVTPWE
jgi:hypothetical protein